MSESIDNNADLFYGAFMCDKEKPCQRVLTGQVEQILNFVSHPGCEQLSTKKAYQDALTRGLLELKNIPTGRGIFVGLGRETHVFPTRAGLEIINK